MMVSKFSQPDLEQLVRGWWQTTLIDVTGEYVWDDEIEAVNKMAEAIDAFPEWARQVRAAMPRYGFEMCAHRWLDGLDCVIDMIGAEAVRPSKPGHCGDVPGRVVCAAEERAAAVEHWLEDPITTDEGLQGRVTTWLGQPTPIKKEAAACFVELVRANFFSTEPQDTLREMAHGWRARAGENEILETMFEGEGFDALLENRCGFKIIDRLDLYIRIVGGDLSQASERNGVCNAQLRFVWRDAPERFEVTRGYLWGLQAYLLGHDAQWLRREKPECAGAAIYALDGVSRAGPPTPLRRWIAASLLKCTKIWCQYTLGHLLNEPIPAFWCDLPDLLVAIEQS